MNTTIFIPDIHPYKYDGDILDHTPSNYDEADAYECNSIIFNDFQAAYNYALGYAFGSSHNTQEDVA